MRTQIFVVVVVTLAGCANLETAPRALSERASLLKSYDGDGDGVPDYRDQCRGLHEHTSVTAGGCPADTDGDGIPNYRDECDDTPVGTPASFRGCDRSGIAALLPYSVEFHVDSAQLTSVVSDSLDRLIARFDAAYALSPIPGLLRVIGHTDDRGSGEYNRALSEHRARSVAVYIETHASSPLVILVRGEGERYPIVDNLNELNRAKNRRVEIRHQPIVRTTISNVKGG